MFKGYIRTHLNSGFVLLWSLTILILAACSGRTATSPSGTLALTTNPLPTVTMAAVSLPTATATSIPTATMAPTATGIFRTNFPDASRYLWLTVATGLNQPVDIQNAGDGSGRLFIVVW